MDTIDDVAGLVSIGQLAKAAGFRLEEVKPLAGWPRPARLDLCAGRDAQPALCS